MYLISKLLMNSLYGRWGMDYEQYKHFITEDLDPYLEKFNILEEIDFNNGKKLIKCSPLHVNEVNINLIKANVNISIAAAIAGYARVYMTQFKNNPNIKLLYSDTDSIAVLKALVNDLVDASKLGMLKLEAVFTEALFLAPKLWAGKKVQDGDAIEVIKTRGLKKDLVSFDQFKVISQIHRFYGSEGLLAIRDLIKSLVNNKVYLTKIFTGTLRVELRTFLKYSFSRRAQ